MTLENNPHLPKMFETDYGFAPKSPKSADATGIERTNLLALVLKTAQSIPVFTAESLSDRLYLPQMVLLNLIEELREDMMLEAKGQDEAGHYRYSITDRGRAQAERHFSISGYVGPAPVSLQAYQAMLEWQIAQYPRVQKEDVEKALSELTLPKEAIDVAGMTAFSGRSLFLFGPPGNGKTSIARMLHSALPGDLWIPHAISVDNSVISLFDPHCHEVVDAEADKASSVDRRWVRIRRPLIVVGGEMTMESMDLAYRESLRYYEAPLHMKANGGTFLIDDFGRQQVAPEDLLNRWIVPMEHHFDYLSLYSGQKIEVPFILNLIFATNLDPSDVTDPAFLRRIGYRLAVEPPSDDLYKQIFRNYAGRYGAEVDDAFLDMVLKRYQEFGREKRSCEPRDIIERMNDIHEYQGKKLSMDQQIFDDAWRAYFGEESGVEAAA